MKAETRQEIARISNELDKYYRIKQLVETATSIVFTSEDRDPSDMVSLDYGENTKGIIDTAKDSLLGYIGTKIDNLEKSLNEVETAMAEEFKENK